MAIDEKYADNVVLKKSALQNLLTNIRNYPIVDIDFMESTDTDELYNDNVWQSYTENTPCIKITYGDPDTTKGNVIFQSDSRKKISQAKKEMVRLKAIQSKWNYYLNRWIKIRDNSIEQRDKKNNELNSIVNNYNALMVNTQTILTTLYSLFRTNFFGNNDYLPQNLVFQEGNTKVFTWENVLASDSSVSTDVSPTVENTVSVSVQLLRNSTVKSIVNNLEALLNEMDEHFQGDNDYQANRTLLVNFKEFIAEYNNIIISETIDTNNLKFVFTPIATSANDIPDYDPNTLYFYYDTTNHGYKYIYEFEERELEQWASTVYQNNECLLFVLANANYLNSNSVFGTILSNFDKSSKIENIIEQVDTIVNHILILLNAQIDVANQHIRDLNTDLIWLATTQYNDTTLDEEIYSEQDEYTFQFQPDSNSEVKEQHSIADLETYIAFLNNFINDQAFQQHPLMYGYKYVKVGDHVEFGSNITATQVILENNALPAQNNGTIRADINGITYEVSVKGFEESSTTQIVVGQSGTTATPSSVIIVPADNSESKLGDADNPWDEIYGHSILPPNSDTTASVGSTTQSWPYGYFDTIQVENIIISGESGSSGGGENEPADSIFGNKGWTNKLITDLYLGTMTNDNFTPTITLDHDDGNIEASGTISITNVNDGTTGTYAGNDTIGSTAASIRTNGGIYAAKNIWAAKVFNAVFNDYAEYRTTIDLKPGRVVVDNDDGSLSCASERLQPGAQVISDTFGHAMGGTSECQTPLAVAGRVLVYPYQARENYHAGMAVCSAPNGTVDIMTREEIKEYPDCIVGIVSEIPQYETWGSDNVNVNGRIWIKIK